MEWQSILNEALSILIPALATALAGWFAYIGNKLKNAYQEKINNETAQAVVKDVVQFVEQVYNDIHGKEKLDKAVNQVATILQSRNINISREEIVMLIESAVYGLNEGLTKEIEEAIKDTNEDIKSLTEASKEDESNIKIEDESEG